MTSITIERLTKDNYDTWKIQVSAYLVKNGTWKYVNGTCKKPELKEGDEKRKKEIETWIIEDEKAKADLILAIHPSELKQIKGCETAHSIWLKLLSIYESKGPAKKATLLKKLLFTKMQDDEDTQVFLRNFMDTVDRLQSMELIVNEEILVIILLYALPDTYENFRCAIETRDILPTLESLKIKISEEFESRKNKSVDMSDAYYIKRNCNQKREDKKGKPSLHKSKFNFKCHNCGKHGHKRSECRFLKSTEEQNYKHNSYYLANEYSGQGSTFKKNNEIKPWCLDSGCTSHMCANIEKFNKDLSLNNSLATLNLANSSSTKIKGRGTAKITVQTGKGLDMFNLQNTLYVPDLRMNLLSVSKITDHGYTVEFKQNIAKVKNHLGEVTTIAERVNDLYIVKEKTTECSNLSQYSKLYLWHQKLGHINLKTLLYMNKHNKVYGMDLDNESKIMECEICPQGKLTQKPFPKSERKSQKLLEIIHSDVCGPMKTKSFGGSKYFITFIDDKSRWCEIRFMKEKKEALKCFQEFKTYAENFTGNKIKYLQSDNGTEYCNTEFDNFLKKNGIKRRLTVPYTPQQNGIAERKNRTLLDMARCILIQSKLSPSFWAEAIATANYIRNRCCSRSINSEIPHKLWFGKKPTVKHFQIFGTQVIALDKKPGRNKFERKGKKCIFVGYEEKSKAYRLWSKEEKRIIISRDVHFLEKFENTNNYQNFVEDINDINDNARNLKIIERKEICQTDETNQELPNQNEEFREEVQEYISDEEHEKIETKRGPGRPQILRSGSRGRPKKGYNIISVNNTEEEYTSLTETPYKETLNSKHGKEWKEAIYEEIHSLIKNKTWKIVDLPQNRKEIGYKIVFTNKLNLDGSIERRKARLVAKGCNQIFGLDYRETFSPVVQMKSVRLLMALAAEFKMSIHHLDIKTAYLNGDIEEGIFMKLPKELEESLIVLLDKGTLKQEEVDTANEWLTEIRKKGKPTCLLQKSLYGLKQSGRQWNKKLDQKLKVLNFLPLKSEPCIYYKKNDDDITIIAVFVDDIIVSSTNIQEINRFKRNLACHFEIKDLGEIKHCLGIQFTHTEKEGIEMSQKHYILDILKRFGMENSRPVKTPLEPNTQLRIMEGKTEELENYPYQNLIGSLMYLAVGTRPDIAYATNYLSQFNTNHTKEHWIQAKRLLRYLKGTMDFTLKFTKNGQYITGYSDADWGGCINDRRSYTGYVFMLSGGPISWQARKQRTVALSSTEAEYMSLSEAVKEALYLQNLLNELGYSPKRIKLYCDNIGAIMLAQNNSGQGRTKHIDIKYHFLKDVITSQRVELEYIETQNMTADIFTKGLTFEKHKNCVEKLCLPLHKNDNND